MGYLLFVRSAPDLGRACREVSEFFTFRSRQSSTRSHVVHGVWIDPNAPLLHVPFAPGPATPAADHPGLLLCESFGISGVWELARLQPPPDTDTVQESPERIIESLRGITGADGLFAPVFSAGANRAAMAEELMRLRRRYPGALAAPLVQDPRNGALAPYDDRD